MDLDKNKQLGYRPNLEYVDEYVSELNLPKNNYDNTNEYEEINSGKEVIDNLIDSMNSTNKLINNLPDSVSDTIQEVYDQILDFVEDELTDQELSHVPNREETIYEDIEENEDDNINDNENVEPDFDNMWDTDDFFNTREEEHSEEEIIQKEYIKNLVDLFEDYSTELNTIISNFWTNFLLSCQRKSTSEIKMLLDNILLSSSNIKNDSKHLLDSAVWQQIIKNTKIDYYSLMFNAENTIKYLKQLKATQELRLRYSRIEEVKGDTKTNQLNNNILKAAKMTYDKKYDVAYENLYRYLRSSNKVLRDTMNSWIQEIKSKQILIEREGIL